MKTATMKLKDIHPAAYNPRVTLKPGDHEYEALKNSLERFGVAEPLIVNERTGNLIGGHQRLNVLKAQGAEETEVVLLDMDEDKEKLLNIALNKIEGDWDYIKLESLFSEISDEDIKFTGFTEDEVRNMFRDVAGFEDTDYEEIETRPGSTKEAGAPAAKKQFSIFLSFPTKEAAEKYLEGKGLDMKFRGTERNITIRMEGTEYGSRD